MRKIEGYKNIKLFCDCHEPHFLKFSQWDDDDEFTIAIVGYNSPYPFWKRLKMAFLFLIGSRRLDNQDVILHKSDMKELKDYLKQFK